VRDVDERHLGCTPVLIGRMMPQIRGDVGLHPGARDGIE
jgi:hypothetical protein